MSKDIYIYIYIHFNYKEMKKYFSIVELGIIIVHD